MKPTPSMYEDENVSRDNLDETRNQNNNNLVHLNQAASLKVDAASLTVDAAAPNVDAGSRSATIKVDHQDEDSNEEFSRSDESDQDQSNSTSNSSDEESGEEFHGDGEPVVLKEE